MNEDTAKELIAAIDRLAAALHSLQSPGYLGGGLHVQHHGIPAFPSVPTGFFSPFHPYQTISTTGGANG